MQYYTNISHENLFIFLSLISHFLGLKRLHHLNVSHNQIQAEGLTSLLGACSCVEIVNISSTVNSHDPAFAPALADYLNVVRFYNLLFLNYCLFKLYSTLFITANTETLKYFIILGLL
jgi:hypothetical protein